MSIRRWVLGKVHGGTPPTSELDTRRGEAREPTFGGTLDAQESRDTTAHLGPYAPLIAAIRDELVDFVAAQLRLHLAIAERDRYMLTSIEIDCEDDPEQRALLRRFIAEFKPEQIKRYLARDVIAGLRNASAIDLSQFAGLDASGASRPGEQEDPYSGLIAELQAGAANTRTPAFEVRLLGRWVQSDAPLPGGGLTQGEPRKAKGAYTPLAGRTFAFDVEDAAGARCVELASVVPGRRYVIGKDETSELRADGVYASRRHCEIWLDEDRWWVVDAGSTNGIRVESGGAATRGEPHAARPQPIELREGAVLVLSAHAQGDCSSYPRIVLREMTTPATRIIPLNASQQATLGTPIAPPRPRDAILTVAAHMSSGVREADLTERALPFAVGRSRNQGLVIDWAHADVSGRHLEIVAVDDAGASVVVHGDNGVSVEGTHYGSGAQFCWKRGETMHLGSAQAQPPCTLTLLRS